MSNCIFLNVLTQGNWLFFFFVLELRFFTKKSTHCLQFCVRLILIKELIHKMFVKVIFNKAKTVKWRIMKNRK
jgi:hypothetical protein